MAASHRRRAAMVLSTVLGALAVAMCAPSRHAAVSVVPKEGRMSWARVIEDWSREHRVYEFWDDKIYARGTFHSPAFRKQFIVHRPEFFGDFSNVMKRELVDLGDGDSENFHSFFLASYVNWRRYDALTHAHTIWTLSLENDKGVRVVAERVKDIKPTPAVQQIYPYVDTRYDRTYLVHFPMADRDGRPVITAETRTVTMKVSSAYAEAKLIWDLVPLDKTGEWGDFGIPRDAGPKPDSGPESDEGFGFGKIFGG